MLPDFEIEHVTSTLTSLVTCDFPNVPTEVLAHRYFFLFRRQHLSLVNYKKCLRSSRIDLRSASTCWRQNLATCCENRFGQNETKQSTCYDDLHQDNRKEKNAASPNEKMCVKMYRKCQQQVRRKVNACLHHMTPVCKSAAFSALKTVRLPMTSLYKLRQRFSNLKAVHLVRDPRAVGASRMRDITYRAKGSRNPIMEAALYCRSVSRDLQALTRLQRDFPGTVLPLVYEDFVTSPVQETQRIYDFIGQPLPKTMKDYLFEKTGGKNATLSLNIASKWKNKLTRQQATSIRQSCKDVFEKINFGS